MRRFWLALIGGLALGALVADDVAAASSSVTKKRSFGLRKKGRGHVQLKPMIAPVRKSKKSKRTYNTAVTVILTVRDNFKVGKICKKGPRITDALLRSWYKSPIPRDYLYERKKRSGKTKVDYRRTPAQKKMDAKLLKVINKTIGMKKEVSGILVVKGSISMGGGSITKLPFSSVNGCDELQEEEKPKKKK